jgi:hypothetical protein
VKAPSLLHPPQSQCSALHALAHICSQVSEGASIMFLVVVLREASACVPTLIRPKIPVTPIANRIFFIVISSFARASRDEVTAPCRKLAKHITRRSIRFFAATSNGNANPTSGSPRSRKTGDVSPIAYGKSCERVKPLTQNASLQHFFKQT